MGISLEVQAADRPNFGAERFVFLDELRWPGMLVEAVLTEQFREIAAVVAMALGCDFERVLYTGSCEEQKASNRKDS